MIDFSVFHLVSPTESAEAYAFQATLLENISETNELDTILRLTLLLLTSPIDDYEEAIHLLTVGFAHHKDLKLALLGAYLISVYKPVTRQNEFAVYLHSVLLQHSLFEQAIICYVLSRQPEIEPHTRCALLLESIEKTEACERKFANNYYFAAQECEKKDRKDFAKKALDNIVEVVDISDCKKLTLEELTDFHCFLDEHILGISITKPVYQTFLNLYH